MGRKPMLGGSTICNVVALWAVVKVFGHCVTYFCGPGSGAAFGGT